ncbi:MAG: DUF2029 domain-containing protein [bacterium]|nr:DUF2029 domain-containing protein [bacterium]
MKSSEFNHTSWRLTVYPVGILLALAIAVVVGSVLAGDAEFPAEAVGGDYPAFYGAGVIAADGDWDELYTLERQSEAQAGLYEASAEDAARFFPYPPQVAAPYVPLASLDYHWSYLVHTAVMALFLWASIWIARPMIPWLRGRMPLAYAAAFLFWPMFRAITGGSNTALTLFLIVAAWRLVHDDRQLAAGLALAGLLYKPQFALPLIGLFLLGRYWRVVAGAAAGTVVFYLWGVFLMGWGWVSDWYELASSFGAKDAEINGHSAISFIGFTQNIFGAELSPPVLIAGALAGGVTVFLSWLWWRGTPSDLPYLMALTMPGILLLSLHAMSHDGAIIVLTVAVLVGFQTRRQWTPWFVTIWVLGAIQQLIRQLGFSPGLFMLLIAGYWAYQVCADRSTAMAEV